MYAAKLKMDAYRKATDQVRQWTEVNLNEKYQNSYGIRWAISEEHIVRGRRKNIRTVTYYHIVIQCVGMGGGGVVMQQPHVVPVYNTNGTLSAEAQQPQQLVYVDQNPNPVNTQQVQVVQVYNPNAAGSAPPDQGPNTDGAPPAYSPQDASAPQQAGYTDY